MIIYKKFMYAYHCDKKHQLLNKIYKPIAVVYKNNNTLVSTIIIEYL